MTALEQFNALNGTKAYRKDLENILQKAKDENNASLVYRISKTLNAFPDVNRFEIEIISYPEAPQGLSGAQHSGNYKEALDDCGRLRKGWKFVKGNVVKIQKKEKPKKESKPKKETGPVKSKEENNSKKETKKDKKYKFVVITDNRPSRVIAVFSYTNPNIKDLRESFWKNGEGKYYETTEEGLRNYTFGMGVYPFEEAKKHIEEKYTEGKDFIYFIIEKDGGRDEAISLVEKPKKETDKTAIDEIIKIVQERLKNQGNPRLYEVLHLESTKGIFIFSWSDLGNIDGTKKKENALAKGLYQYTFPKFKTTQEKIEFSNQVWYDLLINKSLTLKRKIEEPTLNIINYYLGKNTIEDIERASKKTTEETKPKKGKTPKKETGPVKAKGEKASNFSLLQEPTKVLLKFSKDTNKEYYKKYTDEKGFVGVDFLKDNLKDLKKQAIIDEPQGFINTEDFEKSHKTSKIKGIDSLKTIVSKDKLYPYLECVFIEPDTYVATDALKIVVLNRPKNDGLKTGAFYDPNFKCEKLGGCSKEEFYKDLERGFPNYKGVLFPKPKYFTEWIPLEPLIKHLKTGLEVLTKISGLKRVFTIAIKSNIEEKRFDIKNLLDVLLVLESNEAKKIRIEIFKELGNHPIQIKTDNNNLAVIMPLNPNSESSNVISPLKIAPIQLEFILNETGLNAPITEVSTERFKNMKVSELRAFTLRYYNLFLKGDKTVIEKHLKEVSFTTKSGRKIAYGEAMYSAKAAVIAQLKTLIKNSTYNNWGDRKPEDSPNILGYLNFKSKITIDGEKRHLRISVIVDKDRNLELKSYDIGKKKSRVPQGALPSAEGTQLSEGKDTKKSLSRKEKGENLGLNAPRHEGILKEALTEKGKLKKGWYFQDYGIIDPKGKYHPLEREFAYEYKIAFDELRSRAFKQDEKNKQKGFEENIQIENNLKEFFKTLSQKNRKYFKSYKAVEIFYWAFGFEEKPTKFFTIEETNPYNEIQLKVFDKYFSNKNELFTRLENYETLRRYDLTNLGLKIITEIVSFLNKEGKKVRGNVKKIDKKYGLNAPRHEGILKEALTEKGKLKKGWYFQDYGIFDPKGEYFTLERETPEEYEIIKKVLDDKNSKIKSKINEKIYQKEKQQSADRYSKEQSLYLELYEKNNFSKNLTYDYFVFFLSNGMKGFGINEKYSERSFILNTNSPIQKKYIKTLSENNLVEDIKLVEKKQISGRVHYQYQVFLLSKGISLIKKYIKGYREIYNYDENLKKNKQKYGLSMPFYVQEQEKKEIQPSSNSISNKIKAFQGRNFEIFNIENPDLSTFLGEIERKNIGSNVITLTGGAGSGKTRFAFQFMNALAQNYKVGHASLEEHPESKLYFDKVTQYLDSQAQNNISVLENETLEGLENLINENEVIVIDSFAKLREMDSKFLVDKDLRKKYNGKLFLVIFQQTSDGKMRGGSTSEFDGDIILFTKTFDDPKENFVYPSKNRYNALPLSELKYSVFYQQLLQDEEQQEQPVTDLIFDVV